MCLDIIRKFEVTENIGWKIFLADSGDIYSYFYTNLFRSFPLNTWVHEKDFRVKSSKEYLRSWIDERMYPTGFHIFLSKDIFKSYYIPSVSEDFDGVPTVFQVKFRDVVATGYCMYINKMSIKTVVAKEICVLQQDTKDVNIYFEKKAIKT